MSCGVGRRWSLDPALPVAVVSASSCISNSTPSLTISICHRYGSKKKKKFCGITSFIILWESLKRASPPWSHSGNLDFSILWLNQLLGIWGSLLDSFDQSGSQGKSDRAWRLGGKTSRAKDGTVPITIDHSLVICTHSLLRNLRNVYSFSVWIKFKKMESVEHTAVLNN